MRCEDCVSLDMQLHFNVCRGMIRVLMQWLPAIHPQRVASWIRSMPISSTRARRALVITTLLPCLLCASLALLVERPFWRLHHRPAIHHRAAIAMRDDVVPFQKWGTRIFTLPYLESYYERTFYFTQSPTNDTRQAFTTTLTAALTQYDSVDLFLLAHSNHYIDWVATIDSSLRSKLRLVYNTGCYDAAQAQAWLQLGAQTAVAHPGLSDSPVFYFFFLRRWTLGARLDQVVAASNQRMRDVFAIGGAATGGQLDPDAHYANSQAHCFGACTITIGD
jgi:hypothetical protein